MYNLKSQSCVDLNPENEVQSLKVNFHHGALNLPEVNIADITDIGYPLACPNKTSQRLHSKYYRTFTKNQGNLGLFNSKNNHVCDSNHFCFENVILGRVSLYFHKAT